MLTREVFRAYYKCPICFMSRRAVSFLPDAVLGFE
jgi:hypothetical protein